ncbi:MAG: hypothetical protein V8R64_00745 [Thomasclavelia sp.]
MDDEITVKKGVIELEEYNKELTLGLKKIRKVIKNDAKVVFTFHNKDLLVWNSFLRSIDEAKYTVEKVIHQQNRRTGKSNVSNPYGTSGSDFYIRCIKKEKMESKLKKEKFEDFVVKTAIDLIKKRNEPTPYQILFNGILSEISVQGGNLEDFDSNINSILHKHVGSVFSIKLSNSKSGNIWWLTEMINKDNNIIPLTDRVESEVKKLLAKNKEVTIDDVLNMIFKKFPNGLTPDIKIVENCLKKIAKKSKQKWIYYENEGEVK